MWGLALPLLWALGALASNEGYTTFGPAMGVFTEEYGDQILGMSGVSPLFIPGPPGGMDKMAPFGPGPLDDMDTIQTPVPQGGVFSPKKDKHGDCVEGAPCPNSCLEGMPCLHKNCSDNSECDGALKCCKTLCGLRCIPPEFKQPCKENHHCPETLTCCSDGSCDSHCPLNRTAEDSTSEVNGSSSTTGGSHDPDRSTHDSTAGPPEGLIRHDQNVSLHGVEDSNGPHGNAQESYDGRNITIRLNRNYPFPTPGDGDKQHHAERSSTPIENSSDSPPTVQNSSITQQ